jgi:uncharacterized protein YegJ (DUF2314 family)
MRGFIFAILTIAMLSSVDPAYACDNVCDQATGRPWWRFLIYPFVVGAVLYLWYWWTSDPAGIAFDPDDPEKVAAEKEARRSLPLFWEAFKNPAEDEYDFSVKFNLTPNKDAEFIWAYDLKWENDRLYGKLGNEPLEPGYEPDRFYKINPDLIVDWTYFKGNEAKGHFITKVMMTRMPKRFAKRAARELGWQGV